MITTDKLTVIMDGPVLVSPLSLNGTDQYYVL
jgi:hypothetical protein